jgi:pseudouridine-5'-phosphate glycosidase
MSALGLTLSPEVAAALAARKPVVALESTIISHGLPRPSNLQVAREVEEIVRSHGATPATIAILDGKVLVGLTDEQLVAIANRR